MLDVGCGMWDVELRIVDWGLGNVGCGMWDCGLVTSLTASLTSSALRAPSPQGEGPPYPRDFIYPGELSAS